MNVLSEVKIEAMRGMFREGHSIRDIASRLRVSKGTVMRYRKVFSLPKHCRCGSHYGHRGWCTERFHKSLVRQVALHPKKFETILPRLFELWMTMPKEQRDIAIYADGYKFFKELSLKSQLSMLSCGWSHVERYLENEAAQKRMAEERHWLREAKRIMREMCKLYDKHRKAELPQTRTGEPSSGD